MMFIFCIKSELYLTMNNLYSTKKSLSFLVFNKIDFYFFVLIPETHSLFLKNDRIHCFKNVLSYDIFYFVFNI